MRAHTTSQNPALHLLLVGLAVLILNVYLALRRVWLSVHRFGCSTRRTWLTLKQLGPLLVRRLERLLGVHDIEQVASSQIGIVS